MPHYETATEETARKAAEHLITDPVLRPLINKFGLCPIRPHTDYYRELVESIVSQQLSVKAAAAINRRFLGLFGGDFPAPSDILNASSDDLRSAGLSGAKARYVHDLAQHVVDGRLEFSRFDESPNEEIVRELTAVKGIGEWTAHMFLMFSLGRLDILPTGDLGIRNGVMKLYGFESLPLAEQVREIAQSNHWHPYESVASWYIWQSLDNMPKP